MKSKQPNKMQPYQEPIATQKTAWQSSHYHIHLAIPNCLYFTAKIIVNKENTQSLLSSS